jgi:hypothetical protein
MIRVTKLAAEYAWQKWQTRLQRAGQEANPAKRPENEATIIRNWNLAGKLAAAAHRDTNDERTGRK